MLRHLVARGVLREADGRWSADPAIDAGSFGVPEDVRRTITRQVQRLTPAERAMLETMSVLGRTGAAAAMAREHGFRLILPWSSILEGWSLVQIGRADEGLVLLRNRLQAADAGSRQFMTHFHGVFAEACLACGRYEEEQRSPTKGSSVSRPATNGPGRGSA